MKSNSQSTPQSEAQMLRAAQSGDLNAALELSKLYLDTYNPALYKWANVLRDHDMPEGYYLLGKCYQHGIAVEPDYAKAEELYNKAVSMGFHRALTGLASLLLADPATRDKNLPEAVKLLKQGVKEGDEKAMFALALLYKGGKGVARSMYKYENLLTESAHLGYAPAMTELGRTYLNFPEVHDKGIEWLQKAAAHGDKEAQKILKGINKEAAEGDDKHEDDGDSKAFRNFVDELADDMGNSIRLKDKMIADAEAGVAGLSTIWGSTIIMGRLRKPFPSTRTSTRPASGSRKPPYKVTIWHHTASAILHKMTAATTSLQ